MWCVCVCECLCLVSIVNITMAIVHDNMLKTNFSMAKLMPFWPSFFIRNNTKPAENNTLTTAHTTTRRHRLSLLFWQMTSQACVHTFSLCDWREHTVQGKFIWLVYEKYSIVLGVSLDRVWTRICECGIASASYSLSLSFSICATIGKLRETEKFSVAVVVDTKTEREERKKLHTK